MQQWEYLLLTGYYAEGDWLRFRWSDGKDIPGWKQGPSAGEYLNQLGAQGWELVAVHDAPSKNPHFFFKRPK